MINYTIPEIAQEINNNSLFNTGCIDEINKFSKICEDFRLNITSTMELKFIITITIVAILIFYRLWIIYKPFKFNNTEFYKKHIAYRIDMFIVLLLAYIMVYLYIM